MKYWTDGIDNWSNNPNFGFLPLADFVANGVKPGFTYIRVYGKAVNPSKSHMGHSRFPLQRTAADAVRLTLQRLREEGRIGVFAFKLPDGRYEYHKV
jgi:hypothetical protein